MLATVLPGLPAPRPARSPNLMDMYINPRLATLLLAGETIVEDMLVLSHFESIDGSSVH